MARSQLQTSDSTFLQTHTHTHLLFIRRKCCNLKGVYGAMFHVCCFLHKITLVRLTDSSVYAIKIQSHRFNTSASLATYINNIFELNLPPSPTPGH